MENIYKILEEQEVPHGTEFYSSLHGETVKFVGFRGDRICFNPRSGTPYLTYCFGNYLEKGECTVFPSKNQRDWSIYQYILPIENLIRHSFPELGNYKLLKLKYQSIIKMLALADFLNDGYVFDWNNKDEKKIYYSYL